MRYMTYPAGDFLIRVKNAAMARQKKTVVASTNEVAAIAAALKKMGFLDDIKKEGKNLVVSLSYEKKEPFLLGLKLVSRPGLRIYIKVKDLEKIKKPSSLLINTPKGVMSLKEALKARVGGEIIAELW